MPTLDGLRGMAILLVLLHHLFVLKPAAPIETIAANLAELGAHGVDLFFVLSGFLITGILLDTKENPNYFRTFYARRFLRIFPLYYCVLAFAFVVLPALLRSFPQFSSKVPWVQSTALDWPWYVAYASNFLIAYRNAFRHPILDVSWSLAIEEQFYVLWPFIVFITSRAWLMRICLMLILGALFCRIGMWWFGWSWLQTYVITLCRIDALAMGVCVALFFRTRRLDIERLRKRALCVFLVLFFSLSLSFAMGWTHHDHPLMYTVGYTLVGILFSCLLILTVYAPPKALLEQIFTGRFITWMGKVSYGVYLLHLPTRAVVRDFWFGDARFRELPGNPLLWQMVFYLVAGGAVLPLVLLSWHLLENPFLRLKRFFSYEIAGHHSPSRYGEQNL